MYTKTNWSDRVVQNPSTYTMRNNPDGTITLIPAPGTVQNSGTPIKAEYLNNIEKGIGDAHQEIVRIKSDYALKHDHPYLPTNAPCARLSWKYFSGVGSRIVVDGGGNNAAVSYADKSGKADNADLAANATKINNMQVRGGAGLTGAAGYITFSW